MTPREYDQPVPVFAQLGARPRGRGARSRNGVQTRSLRHASVGDVGKAAGDRRVGAEVLAGTGRPVLSGAYNGADRRAAGLTVVEIGRCGRVLQVCAGAPGRRHQPRVARSGRRRDTSSVAVRRGDVDRERVPHVARADRVGIGRRTRTGRVHTRPSHRRRHSITRPRPRHSDARIGASGRDAVLPLIRIRSRTVGPGSRRHAQPLALNRATSRTRASRTAGSTRRKIRLNLIRRRRPEPPGPPEPPEDDGGETPPAEVPRAPLT